MDPFWEFNSYCVERKWERERENASDCVSIVIVENQRRTSCWGSEIKGHGECMRDKPNVRLLGIALTSFTLLYTDALSSCEFDTRQEDKEHCEKWKRKRQDLCVACLSSCREIYFSFIPMMMETTNKSSPSSSHCTMYLYLSKFVMFCVLSLSWFMLWWKGTGRRWRRFRKQEMKKKDDSRQHPILPSESVEHLSGRLFWDDEVVVFAAVAVVGFCGDSFYGMNFWTRMMTVKMMMMMEMMLAEKSNGRRRREKQMIRLI